MKWFGFNPICFDKIVYAAGNEDFLAGKNFSYYPNA